MFTSERKEFSNRVIPTLGVTYGYESFPAWSTGFQQWFLCGFGCHRKLESGLQPVPAQY